MINSLSGNFNKNSVSQSFGNSENKTIVNPKIPKTPDMPKDEVTLSTSNQNNDKKKKRNKIIAIGAGVLASCAVVAAVIFSRGRSLHPANFSSHIDFKKLNSMEEVREFAKTNLGIKDFDLGDDLELANWVLEGLTNINNRFKGKAHMPKKVHLDEKYFEKKPNAAANCDMRRDSIGINKKAFDEALKTLDEYMNLGEKCFSDLKQTQKGTLPEFAVGTLHMEKGADGNWIQNSIDFLDTKIQDEIFDMLCRYKDSPQTFTRFDAMHTNLLIQDLIASANKINDNPIGIMKQLYKNPDVKNIIEKMPNAKTLEECEAMNIDELRQYCVDTLVGLNNNSFNVFAKGSCRGNSQFDFLYHEMGHLLHGKNTSLWDKWFGVLSKKTETQFINDSEMQKIAKQISWYAMTNPKEYVAECFNAIVSGRKLTDKQMELYRKFRGPEIDQFINN